MKSDYKNYLIKVKIMIYIPFIIVAGVLLVWVIFMRIIKKRKVNDAPLGLPKGTIRATISYQTHADNRR